MLALCELHYVPESSYGFTPVKFQPILVVNSQSVAKLHLWN
jgi:hypothetical protein